MSVVGKSLTDTRPVEVAQPVLIAGSVNGAGQVTPSPGSSPSAPTYTAAAPGTFLGHQQITNAQLASSFALTVPSGTQRAVIQNIGPSTATARIDGAATAPVANGPGVIIPVGAENAVPLSIGNVSLNALRVIRNADGIMLNVTYFA